MQRRLSLSHSAYKVSENRETVEASNLKIKVIDEFSSGMAAKIKYLNISHNLISKLENMRQFIFLQEIDVSHNSIKNGKQLLSLLELPRLYKLYVDGNPFLLQPLDEDVLELLIEKETDIQILSGEALNRIKDLQEGQLKVVFLQNYLKKINCHDEILARRNRNYRSDKQSLLNQQATNKNIINKIMPQFYSIIDDPKFKAKIKKDTIGIKRQERVTFQDAMKKKKEKQQSQVDNLIKDILLLVEEQDEDKDENSQHFQEERIASSRYESKPRTYRQSIEEIHKLEDSIGSPEGFRKKMNKIRTNMANEAIEKELGKMNESKKSITPTKFTSPEKISPKNKTTDFSRWEKFNEFSQDHERFGSGQGENFYSFNKTTPMPFKNTSQQQTGEKLKFSTKKQQKLFSINQQKNKQFVLPSTRRKDKNGEVEMSNQQDLSMNQKSAAQLYEQYYIHLTKYNPAFALLYSDISSLESEEKDVLIEALSKDHQNKTIQLFMERIKVKNMKKISLQNANAHEKQIYELRSKIAEQKENYQLCKQYCEQLERQNHRLSELIKVVSEDMTELKQENKLFKQINIERGNKLSELTSDIKSKQNYLKHLEECQEFAQIIKANKNKRIKAQHFSIILKRAAQNMRVIQWTAKRQQKQHERLINFAWSLMKKHLLLQVLAKMKQSDKNTLILKNSFSQWKFSTQKSKQIKKSTRKFQNLLLLKSLRHIKNRMERKKAAKKQLKLQMFWADHHFLKIWFFKIADRVNQSKSLSQTKMKNIYQNYLRQKKFKIFLKIKSMAVETKKRLANSVFSLKQQKISNFYTKWREFFIKKLFEQQARKKIEAVARIISLRRSDRNKIEGLKNLKRQNQQIKQKLNMIASRKKQKTFQKLLKSMNRLKQRSLMKQKAQVLYKKIYIARFHSKMKKYLRYLRSIKYFFLRIKRKSFRNDIKIERRSYVVEEKLKNSRIKSVFYKLFRNKYENRLITIQVNQRMEQQQTKMLLQKMRTIQSMELQAIKTEHNRHLQLIEEEQIRKQIEYRNNLMKAENGKNELVDTVKILKKEVEGFRQRQNIFFREKELIEDQVRMAESGKVQLAELNQNLRIEIVNINTKYQRMLELYTQAMIQLEKKQKQKQVEYEEKQRKDKTVQKQKRIGLAKNGQFTSLRQRS